jgi:hypothetical protein
LIQDEENNGRQKILNTAIRLVFSGILHILYIIEIEQKNIRCDEKKQRFGCIIRICRCLIRAKHGGMTVYFC